MEEQDKGKVSAGEGGVGGLPSVQFTDTQASPTSSSKPDNTETLLKGLEPAVEKMVQRFTDKRFSKMERGENVVQEALAMLKERGVDIPKDVEREFGIREYIDQRIASLTAQKPVGNPPSGQSDSTGNSFDVVAELQKLNLNTGDPDVLRALTKQYRNPDHFRAEMAVMALSKAGQKTPSDTVSTAMSGVTTNPKLSEIEIEQLAAKRNNLYLNPTKNALEIAAIERKLRESGVPID